MATVSHLKSFVMIPIGFLGQGQIYPHCDGMSRFGKKKETVPGIKSIKNINIILPYVKTI